MLLESIESAGDVKKNGKKYMPIKKQYICVWYVYLCVVPYCSASVIG
jgi:hypothetical protein